MPGGLAYGFARTPRGALLAAVHIAVRANPVWGPEVFAPTVTGQVVGPDAEALLAACRKAFAEHRPTSAPRVVVEAYRWAGYTASAATVDLITAIPADQADATVRAATRIQVQWRSADWRALAPPLGDWGRTAAPVTSLTGYTRFLAKW